MNITPVTRHRDLHHRFGAVLVGAALIGATACGNNVANRAPNTVVPTSATAPTVPSTTTTSTTTAPTTTVARPTATVDEQVEVSGHRVHVRCTGHGATTVLLIAGFETGSESWSKVEPAIDTQTRVCAYDRPGTGTSDPATTTETFATQASDLRAVLATVSEPGPYVIVGHSFGGAEAVTFASTFTAEVIGLVLVDASPVAWPAAICAVADDHSDAATMLRGLCASWSTPLGNVEHLDVFAAFTGASNITSLGSLPMTIITAVARTLPAGLAVAEVARLTRAWNDGQQQWARLSTDSRVLPVENTGHHIELDHPDIVIDAITRLLPQ